MNDVPSIAKEIIKESRNMTAIQSFMASETQISKYRAENIDCLELLVSILLTRLSDAQMVTNRMGDSQIADCAQDIIDEFWYLRLHEIVFILNEARKKKTFNRFDQSVIFECFNDYCQNRQSVVEESRRFKMEKEEAEKQEEIEIIKKAYEEYKQGTRKPLISSISDTKKVVIDKEHEYNTFKALYLSKKEIEKQQNQQQNDEQGITNDA